MVSHYTTLVHSLGLRIGPACEAGLSAGTQMEHVPPQKRKKEKRKKATYCQVTSMSRVQKLFLHVYIICTDTHFLGQNCAYCIQDFTVDV